MSNQTKPTRQARGKKTTSKPNESAGDYNRKQDIVLHALLSLGCFILGLVVLSALLWKVELLVRLGFVGNLYYIVLLPLGLAAGGFLFGVLRSFASFKGERFGAVLELGGPVVVFCLVVLGGFFLVPSATAFPVTVFVHGVGNAHDAVLKNSGRVWMDLGSDRRDAAIGGKGEAQFNGIPSAFRGQKVSVWAEAPGFESVSTEKQELAESIYLPVRRSTGRVSGRIQNEKGTPVPGAKLRVGEISATTDQSGYFQCTIPGELLKPEMTLQVMADGYESSSYSVVPNSNEMTFTLRNTK